jgi:isopenicillin-N epimerase
MNLRDQFLLTKEITYLNHGSFGACPAPVFENYQYWQTVLESEPVEFFTSIGPQQLEISKAALASFLNCDPSDLVFTTNPSYAINIIAKSLDLKPGDEIITTDHEYGAMDRTWKYYCGRSGAVYKQVPVSLPYISHEQLVEDIFAGVTEKTKAIFISHITSPTALIFPVEQICSRAREAGIMTIVDGAHVPGHIPLDLGSLNADIYTGACHKWMLTPKGCAFLYVRKDLQELFDPLLISWGYDADEPGPSKFMDYHQMQGTRDYSAFLTLPAALKFRDDHNWSEASDKCKKLISKHYPILCETTGSSIICDNDEDHMGQMCTIPVPFRGDARQLKSILFNDFRIEIPVIEFGERIFVRMSINGYNSEADIERLRQVLAEIVK